MRVTLTFWGGRVLGIAALLACIVAGFLSDTTVRPFWWFGGYIALFSVFNLTTLAMSFLTRAPAADINELARNLISDRIQNPNINDDIYFMLKRKYKEADLARAIDEWLPDNEKGNYTIYTQPFCWSILTIIFGKGIRPAMLVYKPHFYHLKTVLDDAVTVMGIGLLALANLKSMPWDFWTGSGYPYGLFVGAGIAGLMLAIKYIWIWIAKTEYATDWRGVLDGILGATLLPALEEVSLGWIMPMFIAASMIQIGFPPLVAAAVGICITVPYYVAATLWQGWRQGIFTIAIRLICTTMMFIWGFPAVMLLRFITHLDGFIFDWLMVRKHRRESPMNLYK